jgi:hypothetical protein
MSSKCGRSNGAKALNMRYYKKRHETLYKTVALSYFREKEKKTMRF